jgi:ferredoxin-NADP reductase
VRSYSLSAPGDGRRLRLSVRREGRASAHLHDRVGRGAVLEVGAPRGDFVLGDDAGRPVVLLSAGIGVTPVLTILAELAARSQPPAVTWIHVARSGAEHALAAEARELLAALPVATAHVRFTRPGPGDRVGVDFDAPGRLDRDGLAALLPGLEADVFLCGPQGFMADARADLVALGVEESHIHIESFGAAAPAGGREPHPPPGPPGTGPSVAFARSGVTVRFDERWRSLLELAEDCDVPADWSCRTGVCHRCETGLVAGTLDYDPEPLDRPGGGYALLCCSRPAGDVVLDL